MICESLPTEVIPTEETVEALIEYLVGPLLPLKHQEIASESPSEAQQESVAKQVHTAAVLYNYFHLYHHRKSHFLKFDHFCNLAIMFKPSILHYMKYMCQSDRPVLDDPENQLSITERAIMDACNMSETLLNASGDISNIIKEWLITKVAVLLIDSKKEKCFLKFNNGVRSVIENDVYTESENHKRPIINHDEEGFRKLAFSAVRETTGNVNCELKVLKSQVVYSLSQANTATLFYIVQSTQSINEDHLVPIQEAIYSLQGPVVKKSLGRWVVTPAVEYCYLLPYAEIISKLYSRVSNSLPDANIFQGSQKSCEKASSKNKKVSIDLKTKSKSDSKSVHVSNSSKEQHPDSKFTKNILKSNSSSNDYVSSQLTGSPFDQKVKETKKSTDNNIINVSSDNTKRDKNRSCKPYSNNSSSGANHNNIDTPLNEKKSTTTYSISSKENLKNLEKKSTVSQSTVSPNVARTQTLNHALEDICSTADLKISELSEAALRALINKKLKLYNQQKIIEGELTLCDRKIQAIKHGGIRDCLALKLEAVIDCCNEICKQDDTPPQEHTNPHVLLSGKSNSEAHFTLREACKELDDICLSNNWMLPTYHTSLSDGGAVANVTVKGTNFECLGVSDIQPSILEARNSAATRVITRLQQMASEMSTALI